MECHFKDAILLDLRNLYEDIWQTECYSWRLLFDMPDTIVTGIRKLHVRAQSHLFALGGFAAYLRGVPNMQYTDGIRDRCGGTCWTTPKSLEPQKLLGSYADADPLFELQLSHDMKVLSIRTIGRFVAYQEEALRGALKLWVRARHLSHRGVVVKFNGADLIHLVYVISKVQWEMYEHGGVLNDSSDPHHYPHPVYGDTGWSLEATAENTEIVELEVDDPLWDKSRAEQVWCKLRSGYDAHGPRAAEGQGVKYVHTLMEVSANDLGRGVGDEGVDVTMMDLEKMKLVFEKIGVGAKGVEVKTRWVWS